MVHSNRFFRGFFANLRPVAFMLLLLSPVFHACTSEKNEEPEEYRNATALLFEWNDLALELERQTQGFRPPVTARMFAYVEMAAYESALPDMEGYASMERYCAGYSSPRTSLTPEQYCLPAGLNAAYATILRRFFGTAPEQLRVGIDRLEAKYRAAISIKTNRNSLEQSIAYGVETAERVWQWSKTDSTGHDSNLRNYAQDYTLKTCAGCWQPTDAHMPDALLPGWKNTRAFIVGAGDLPLHAPIAFDETPGSPFHVDALEVFAISQPLSKENQWIAELWSDDVPGLTVNAAGRWISIVTQALKKARAPFPHIMETYLKSGLALCDAGIHVWRSKYQYNVERPETYIRRVIRPDWSPLHTAPPFPSYPSGHAAFGAAVTEVLSAQLGEQFQMEDRTHDHRQEFEGKARCYNSFAQMAEENAASRIYLGVHYRMDGEEGLRIGKIVGQRIAGLPLRHFDLAQ